ncbi:MAG: hypothetical protein FRX49_07658 [Trebouxia sp. A1-2]|nr:MAG: hypothetical protein FRX49_07658 [Trebouxia sp. A1-2]
MIKNTDEQHWYNALVVSCGLSTAAVTHDNQQGGGGAHQAPTTRGIAMAIGTGVNRAIFLGPKTDLNMGRKKQTKKKTPAMAKQCLGRFLMPAQHQEVTFGGNNSSSQVDIGLRHSILRFSTSQWDAARDSRLHNQAAFIRSRAEVVEDDWSHDQSNTLSNQLHQTHTLGQTHMLGQTYKLDQAGPGWTVDQAGFRIKLAALLQHTTMRIF